MNLEAISLQTHGRRFWRPLKSYNLAKTHSVCRLAADELPRAIMSLPVGFIQSSQGFDLIAMQGLDADSNLLVDPNGNWLLPYVPAFYRGLPFQVAEIQSGKMVLCLASDIDETDLEDRPEPFFAANGELTEKVQSILNFLNQVALANKRTKRICDLLDSHHLIEPWEIKFSRGNETVSVNGLYRINESAFLDCSGEVLEELNRLGAISVIYGQLMSIQHLHTLQKLVSLRRGNIYQRPASELNFQLSSSHGNIDLSSL